MTWLEICGKNNDCSGCCPYSENGFGEYGQCRESLMADAYDLLKKPEWIPVTERLPKHMANKVLVYLQHEDLVDQIGYGHYERYQGVEMWYDLESGKQFSDRGYKVTHWMPLPESPKGERLALS